MTRYRLVPLLGLLIGLTACTGGPAGEEVVKSANTTQKSGDLPAAFAEYEKALSEHGGNAHAVNGAAHAYMLAGRFDKADSILAGLEESAGDAIGEVKLRRAIVALRAGNLDAVKAHGTASNLPAGQVLAAEVHMVDAEPDEAIALLKRAAEAGGAVGDTARQYLDLLEGGSIKAGLAEATALWAVGDRATAVEAAEELVKALPDDADDKGELLLLWASRAVTSDRPGIAANLVDAAGFADIPQEQQWRLQATKAMIAVAEGNGDAGVMLFDLLEQVDAPTDGLADARATAAALTDDRAVARKLVENVESGAAGRSLLHAGAGKVAPEKAPEGPLKKFLEGR